MAVFAGLVVVVGEIRGVDDVGVSVAEVVVSATVPVLVGVVSVLVLLCFGHLCDGERCRCSAELLAGSSGRHNCRCYCLHHGTVVVLSF